MLEIKPLIEISYEQWLPLWQGYQQFYKVQLEDEINLNTWRRLTDQAQSQMYGFAAVVDGKIAGIVHVIEHDSCWTLQPYAYLQDLYTEDQYRGQGIARALIQRVHQYAVEERKCDRVHWLTQQDNQTAQRLYDQIAKKTGFIQYRI